MRDVFAAEASSAGWSPPPELPRSQLRQAAARAKAYADASGLPFEDAAVALARAGLEKARAHSQAPGFALLEAEPGARYRPRAKTLSGAAQGLQRAVASNPKEFEDAPDEMEQLRAAGWDDGGDT
jgi:hypothetical protein